MNQKETTSGLCFETWDGESPQGKPKVYFCAHPKDFGRYFEQIREKLRELQPNCALFFCENGDNTDFSEKRREILSQMQLFILPFSGDFLYSENVARLQEFEFALEKTNRIAVLPLMMEPGLESEFNRICGDFQVLNPNDPDPTSVPFDQKLKNYLENLLVGEETMQLIQAAFDRYIFLSYRKKDRAEAQKLMKLIHVNPLCRDIAIWYDEFLVPGEHFNKAIQKILQKCDLFTLVVTENLVNEPNYVQEHEFPDARDSGKPILPVTMRKTDPAELKRQYPGIPACVPGDNHVSEAVMEHLPDFDRSVCNDPKHNYLIGLAYLNGIDVEIDRERAFELIHGAAEAGVIPACEKLVTMYETGEGVRRDYELAAQWQERLAELYGKAWKEAPGVVHCGIYFDALWCSGDAWLAVGREAKALEVYTRMKNEAEEQLTAAPENLICFRILSVSCNNLGDLLLQQGKLTEAEESYRKSLEIAEEIVRRTGTNAALRDVSVSNLKLGELLQQQGKESEAEESYRKALKIAEELVRKTGTNAALRDVSVSYEKLGDLLQQQGKLLETEEFYRKSQKIDEELVCKTGTNAALRDVAVSNLKLGNLLLQQGKLTEAEKSYRKSQDIRENLVRKTGTNAALRDLSFSCNNFGDLLQQQGKLPEAEEYYRKSLEICKELVRKTGTNAALRDVSVSYNQLGRLYGFQHSPEKAEPFFQKALDTMETVVKRTEALQQFRDYFNHCHNLCITLLKLKKYQEQEAVLDRVLEIGARYGEKNLSTDALRKFCFDFIDLSGGLRDVSRLASIKNLCDRTAEIQKRVVEQSPSSETVQELLDFYFQLSDKMEEARRFGEAEDYLRRYQDTIREYADRLVPDERNQRKSDGWLRLGRLYMNQNTRLADALDCFREVLKFSDSPSLEIRMSLSEQLETLADRLQKQEQYVQAKECFSSAVELLDPLAAQQQSDSVDMRCLRCYVQLYRLSYFQGKQHILGRIGFYCRRRHQRFPNMTADQMCTWLCGKEKTPLLLRQAIRSAFR